jgi:hypothetical protein
MTQSQQLTSPIAAADTRTYGRPRTGQNLQNCRDRPRSANQRIDPKTALAHQTAHRLRVLPRNIAR